MSAEEIVVDVNVEKTASVAYHVDVAERAYVVDASCAVDGVEHCGERRQPVGSGYVDLAHHVDEYRAYLSQGEAYVGLILGYSRIFGGECLAQSVVGFGHGQAVEIDRSDLFDHDASFGRYDVAYLILAGSPYVDDHFVARSEAVVRRGCHVFVRLECERLVVE